MMAEIARCFGGPVDGMLVDDQRSEVYAAVPGGRVIYRRRVITWPNPDGTSTRRACFVADGYADRHVVDSLNAVAGLASIGRRTPPR